MKIFSGSAIALESLLDKEFFSGNKTELSAEATKALNHEVALGLVLSYYEYDVRKGTSKEESKKNCSKILSAMMDDGECSVSTMQMFMSKADALEKTVMHVVSDKPEEHGKLAELKALISFSQSPVVEKLAESEKAVVADFAAKMAAYQEATNKLVTMLQGHVAAQTDSLLKTYKQFDKKFVELFK